MLDCAACVTSGSTPAFKAAGSVVHFTTLDRRSFKVSDFVIHLILAHGAQLDSNFVTAVMADQVEQVILVQSKGIDPSPAIGDPSETYYVSPILDADNREIDRDIFVTKLQTLFDVVGLHQLEKTVSR